MSFTKFSPSDAPNHDDCHELFNDPAKLEDKLILNDGCKFFMSDPAESFGFLRKVDWTESLRGSKHRELHFMWGLLASAHQFWFLHICMFALTLFWVARDDLKNLRSLFCHARCWFFFGNSYCCSLDLFCSGLEVGVGHLLQEPISSVGCVSAVHQISSTGIGMSGREDPPDDETTGEEVTVETVEKMAWPWQRFIRELADWEDALPEMLFVMMLVCWVMWRLCCRRQRPEGERSPIHAIRKRVNSSPEGAWW